MEWKDFLNKEKELDYYKSLHEKVMEEYQKYTVYPPYHLIYNAFKLTPFDQVKVVIVGQDPYHEFNQATGLAFSVNKRVALPPSLQNIYKELENEYNVKINQDGDLSYLARQGVLLLNRTLTVREHEANSHQSFGYDILLNHVIEALNKDDKPKVFILWGSFARSLKSMITNPNHLILESSHPSPLSAYRGFFGNNHFIKTNEFLKSHNLEEIRWIK